MTLHCKSIKCFPLLCFQLPKDHDRLAEGQIANEKVKFTSKKCKVQSPGLNKAKHQQHKQRLEERELSKSREENAVLSTGSQAGVSQRWGGRQPRARGTSSLQAGRGQLAPLGLAL